MSTTTPTVLTNENFKLADFTAEIANPFGYDIDVSIICPYCHKQVHTNSNRHFSFYLRHRFDYTSSSFRVIAGFAVCPNPDCSGLLQLYYNPSSPYILRVYPPSYINFDDTAIPASITNLLREAIICHGNECYTAGAIMVRRTLEEICEINDSKGNNLTERLKGLEKILALPEGYIDGLNDIRLLGNDAAHTEKKSYENIGEEAVAIAIEITKELLKAVYQYKATLEKLKKHKKSKPPK